MTTLRRRLVRPPSPPSENGQLQRQLRTLRGNLERERLALVRWQIRLKRAFNAVTKHQKRITRIERQLIQMEA